MKEIHSHGPKLCNFNFRSTIKLWAKLMTWMFLITQFLLGVITWNSKTIQARICKTHIYLHIHAIHTYVYIYIHVSLTRKAPYVATGNGELIIIITSLCANGYWWFFFSRIWNRPNTTQRCSSLIHGVFKDFKQRNTVPENSYFHLYEREKFFPGCIW